MTEHLVCRDLPDTEAHLNGLVARLAAVEGRVRHIEKQLDTLGSPWWRRCWFRLDGFKPWYIVEPRRSWRPWRKWWIS